MTQRKKGKRAAAAALSVIMILAVAGTAQVGAAGKSLSELNKDIQRYEQQLKEQNKSISDKTDYNKSLDAQIGAMNEKLSLIQSEIDTLNGQINAKYSEISKIQAELNQKQFDIDVKNLAIEQKEKDKEETLQLLKDRIRASYMAGQISSLDVLLGAENFGQFLSNMEYIKRIATHDRDLIDTLAGQVSEIETVRNQVTQAVKELEAERLQKENSINEVEAKKSALDSVQREQKDTADAIKQKLSDNNRDIQQLNSQYAQTEQEKESTQRELAKAQNELSQMSKPPGNSGNTGTDSPAPTPSNTGYTWPVPGSNYVIQGYKGLAHTGIDITAGRGAAIVAVRDGVVKEAYPNERHDGNGWWTYGKYLIIDHGDGEITLYAHCDALTVTQGQRVVAGQQIAEVGSTGKSDGFHLHLEMHRNGSRVDPLKYLR